MTARRLILAVLSLSLAASTAVAGSFDDDAGNAAWAARADNFTKVLTGEVRNGDLKSDLGAACSGVTGDMSKFGSHRPMWAAQAFSEFCSGVNVMGRNGLNRYSCRSFKQALGDIKADPAKDPADIVRAADAWKSALSGTIASAKDQHDC